MVPGTRKCKIQGPPCKTRWAYGCPVSLRLPPVGVSPPPSPRRSDALLAPGSASLAASPPAWRLHQLRAPAQYNVTLPVAGKPCQFSRIAFVQVGLAGVHVRSHPSLRTAVPCPHNAMKFKLLVARRPGSSQLCLPYGLPSWVCFLWGLLGQLSVSVAAFWWLFPGLPIAGGHSGTYPSLLGLGPSCVCECVRVGVGGCGGRLCGLVCRVRGWGKRLLAATS